MIKACTLLPAWAAQAPSVPQAWSPAPQDTAPCWRAFSSIWRFVRLRRRGCIRRAGPEGLLDRKAPGQPSRLNGAHRAAIAAMIESGLTSAIHGAVRRWLADLCQWLWEEHQVTVSKQTLSREP